jgi:hypothetical protein
LSKVLRTSWMALNASFWLICASRQAARGNGRGHA